MEDLILKIIDIEEEAQQFIRGAKTADGNFDSSIKTEERELHNRIVSETKSKCEDIIAEAEERAKEKCDSIRKDEENQASLLRKRYDRKKEEWTERIFKSIIA